MQVTVIKEDNVVVVDGEALNFDFQLDNNIWAIQWDGTSGHIEYNDGTPNKELTDFTEYQVLVDMHATEKKRRADEESAEEAARLAARTYKDFRAAEYPSLEEQADMQYWDAVNGTTVWQDTISAVKSKYPKE